MPPPTLHAHPLRSGKTTLLRALAGQLRERADLQVWAVAAVWAGGPPCMAAPLRTCALLCRTAKGAAWSAVHCMCLCQLDLRHQTRPCSPVSPVALPHTAWCQPAQVTGKVLYNGHSFDEFIPERSAAYISQVGVAHRGSTCGARVRAAAALAALAGVHATPREGGRPEGLAWQCCRGALRLPCLAMAATHARVLSTHDRCRWTCTLAS